MLDEVSMIADTEIKDIVLKRNLGDNLRMDVHGIDKNGDTLVVFAVNMTFEEAVNYSDSLKNTTE